MRFCSHCGNALKENQKYCNRCGQPVNVRSAQYVVEEKGSKWPWIVGIIGVLILLAGLAFAGLQIYKNMASNQAQTQNNTTQQTSQSNTMHDSQDSPNNAQQTYSTPQSSAQPAVTPSAPRQSMAPQTRVTRSNVIDLVEQYEGHYLDTDTYTFKEPEQRADGSWGFSILYKSGRLAGSYIVDSDGTVTKYDEKGRPE